MPTRRSIVPAMVAAVAITAAATCALGQSPAGDSHRGGDRRDGPSEHYRSAPTPPQHSLTLHGGQYLATDANRYEVVFMPLQTRIYVYDKAFKPLSARDCHVEMSLRFPDEREIRRISFRYIDVPDAAGVQDYVVAVLDVAQLKDKETPITFRFSDLPDPEHPTASFSPVFTMANVRPYVAQVLATKADTDAVVRQRVCPVCGQPLGSKGPVVKLLIADHPLFVCDDNCMAAVRESPRRYLWQRRPQR